MKKLTTRTLTHDDLRPDGTMDFLKTVKYKPKVDENRYILCLEDNRKRGDLTRELLEKCGYQVKSAKTFKQALHLIEEKHPAVILSDYIATGGVNGFEFREALHKRSDCSNIPFIYVTAFGAWNVNRYSYLLHWLLRDFK